MVILKLQSLQTGLVAADIPNPPIDEDSVLISVPHNRQVVKNTKRFIIFSVIFE